MPNSKDVNTLDISIYIDDRINEYSIYVKVNSNTLLDSLIDIGMKPVKGNSNELHIMIPFDELYKVINELRFKSGKIVINTI